MDKTVDVEGGLFTFVSVKSVGRSGLCPRESQSEVIGKSR